jgi:hypothetical protein
MRAILARRFGGGLDDAPAEGSGDADAVGFGPCALGLGEIPGVAGGLETVAAPQAASPAATDPTTTARSSARRVISSSLVTPERYRFPANWQVRLRSLR